MVVRVSRRSSLTRLALILESIRGADLPDSDALFEGSVISSSVIHRGGKGGVRRGDCMHLMLVG